MVVTSGEKSGESSGANQYWFKTCSAWAKETSGVTMVASFPVPETVANDQMITVAEELVAFGTDTGYRVFASKAFFSSAAGSAILKNTAVCSRNDMSYCMSACASPSADRVTVMT